MKPEIKCKLLRNGEEHDLQVRITEEVIQIQTDEQGRDYVLQQVGRGGIGTITAFRRDYFIPMIIAEAEK